MNAIQKATVAASALAITLVGAALVTAPLAFARSVPAVAYHAGTVPSLRLAASGQIARHDEAGVLALNRR